MSKIPYDLSKVRGIVFDVDGVLSPSCIPLGNDGMPCRMVNIKDGYAIQLAVKQGLKIAIITGGVSEAVRTRFQGLGVNDIYMGKAVKIDILTRWMADNNLNSDEVIYVGDDIPDYVCMRHVGLAVAPRDAAVDIKSVAGYISPVDGGHGVARDILEEVLKAKGLWMNDEKAFGW
ncbi:MAG: HAD hydrolase-like protein [Muribaculum sp.]|nr:HAD hydrolase-like protein [Muribaculum sp.]